MYADSMDTRKIQIELVPQTWDGVFPGGCPHLDSNYFLEDCRGHGGGLVISEDMPLTDSLDRAIHDFLSPIVNNAVALQAFAPLLRITVRNRALADTLHTSCVPLIARFGAELEISFHPA